MCVVSMIYDHFHDKWDQYRQTAPSFPFTIPNTPLVSPAAPTIPPADIAEFYKLLERAREYDKRNNEPDCELASKKERLKKLSQELGVTIDFP